MVEAEWNALLDDFDFWAKSSDSAIEGRLSKLLQGADSEEQQLQHAQARVVAMEEELKSKEQEVVSKDKKLKSKEQQFQHALARVVAMEEEVKSKEQEVVSKDKELKSKELASASGTSSKAVGNSASFQPQFDAAEDVDDVAYKPIVKFATDITPSKDVDTYLREDMMSVDLLAKNVGPFMEALITEGWKITKDKVVNSQVLKHHAGLTEQSTFAIVVFTMEIQNFRVDAEDENEFYRNYNNALRGRAPKVMKKMAGYSHYFFQGLACLPKYEGILWRGIKEEDKVQLVIDKYVPKYRKVYWNAFSSATPDRNVAKEFAGSKGLLFRCEVKFSARNINDVSAIPREQERLILPNTEFLVENVAFRSEVDGIWEVHLVEPPDGCFSF